ncbi:hypothetical protein PPYR_06375 [Photinus pyralis]|uniref:CCHC-type domain-containing protein n=4 Tax=Photinus pyralis TaxID=7054 RepID=A0A1Y1LA51_PHOPY|nr:mucin-2 isoform X1 [Photinus pyralis]KAB0800635.1 hypothetical protein PPYR_06375 [Photinus pyralis]
MVCKEDVLLWFKDLEGYKRLDVMYELLSMCVPFEVRFLGSCIEEIGKHSYQELRGSAIIANDIDKLTKDSTLTQGLFDEGVRHRVLIYLSLLSASNCKCANWLYKTLLRTEWVESCVLRGNVKDENLQSELLLLFTMGLYHPAFTFDQKNFFGNMLAHVIEQRECKKHLTTKPFPSYSPGMGYNHLQTIISQHDTPSVPVKTTTVCQTDRVPHPQQTQTIIPHPISGPVEVMQMWTRPGFIGQVHPPPEISPFPPPPASPIVSESSSPCPSRTASPHRTYPIRSATGLQSPSQMVEVLPVYKPQVPPNPVSQPNLPPFGSAFISNDEDCTHIPDEKMRESPWINPVMVRVDMKPPNGIRLPPYSKLPEEYCLGQMQALNLDVDNSLQCSSSSSSSTNSLNHSPPDTPTVPTVPHHGPGRGETKPRMNGVPQQYVNTGHPNMNVGLPVCDTTPPPHPAPTLNNCSVPYSNYPPQVTLTAIPNRSVYQPYRPPFSAPFTYPTPEMFSYTYPYVFLSSTPSQLPNRTSNCFNCGAVGHAGADCNGQTVEDITQKKAYTLDYNSALPNAEK